VSNEDNPSPASADQPDNDQPSDVTRDVLAEAESIVNDAASSLAEEAASGETLVGDVVEDPAVVAAQRDEYLDSLRRLQADFDNYRKRVQRDQEMAADRASEKLIDAMVPVLDTFEFALGHESDPNGSPLAKMHDQLLSALEAQGLERLAPLDLVFDPNEAEAVMSEPGEGIDGNPVVIEVLRAGYRWRGRVMRAAMVKVRG
jgi:molecular chaperone GrpE